MKKALITTLFIQIVINTLGKQNTKGVHMKNESAVSVPVQSISLIRSGHIVTKDGVAMLVIHVKGNSLLLSNIPTQKLNSRGRAFLVARLRTLTKDWLNGKSYELSPVFVEFDMSDPIEPTGQYARVKP
ncbi:hypothetical protein [Aeromonas sobria]|uniref:hypothetical protein n=1 Tax=Aeromonas sobria TaxID=646 RepID=UPI0012FE9470|nr:hypothetical protein [Aeromonas sobria]